MLDSTQSSDGVITRPSSTSVAQTIDGLRRVMADRGFTVLNVIDHSGVAERAGVQMPDSKLVMFGKPAVGASVMVAAPLAALDIPLKVLVWEDRNGAVSVSYNSPEFLAGRPIGGGRAAVGGEPEPECGVALGLMFSTTTLFTGPLENAVQGVDLSWLMAGLGGGVVHLIGTLTTAGRPAAQPELADLAAQEGGTA